MRHSLLPVLLLAFVGCDFPKIQLTPAGQIAAKDAKDCMNVEGLELCLQYDAWHYGGLVFRVEARNMGNKSTLIDPVIFRCAITNPKGMTLKRDATDPDDPSLNEWYRDFFRREGLLKHTLDPGENVQGTIIFAFREYEHSAYRKIKVTANVEGSTFTFDFEEAKPSVPAGR
jgi:hypothetical protein